MDDTETNAASAEQLTRLSVNLNRETADALLAIARETGLSVTEVMRRSIAVYKYVSDEQNAGREMQTYKVGRRSGRKKKVMVLTLS